MQIPVILRDGLCLLWNMLLLVRQHLNQRLYVYHLLRTVTHLEYFYNFYRLNSINAILSKYARASPRSRGNKRIEKHLLAV